MKLTKAFFGNSKFVFGFIAVTVMVVYSCNGTAEKKAAEDPVNSSFTDSISQSQESAQAPDTIQQLPPDSITASDSVPPKKGAIAPPPKP